MMQVLEVLVHPVSQRLTLTLLHFLWQGSFLALALAVILKRSHHAPTRHAYCLSAMLAMALCPVLTFAVLEQPAKGPVAIGPISSAAVQPQGNHEVFKNELRLQRETVAEREVGASQRSKPGGRVRSVQPFFLSFWGLGVTALSLRLLLSYLSLQRLQRDRRSVSAELAVRIAQVGQRLGVGGEERVFSSQRLYESMVVGFWRPIVLLPACWLAETSPDILEAVIAHELAHIRRRDLWINLFQRVMETLLFYHPAVWWVSRRLRLEREMSCDELAVAATGDRVAYINALEWAARKRLDLANSFLAAAIGGDRKMKLLDRVRYLLAKTSNDDSHRGWPAGFLTLFLVLSMGLTLAVMTFPSGARAGDGPVPGEPPAKSVDRSDLEVVKENVEELRKDYPEARNVVISAGSLAEAVTLVQAQLEKDGKPEYAALISEERVRKAIPRAIKSHELNLARRGDEPSETFRQVVPTLMEIAGEGVWPDNCVFIWFYGFGDIQDRMSYPGFGLRLDVLTGERGPTGRRRGFSLAITDLYFGRMPE